MTRLVGCLVIASTYMYLTSPLPCGLPSILFFCDGRRQSEMRTEYCRGYLEGLEPVVKSLKA